jgi:hypothetical protein
VRTAIQSAVTITRAEEVSIEDAFLLIVKDRHHCAAGALSDVLRDRLVELWPTLPEAAKSRMLEKAIQSASEQEEPS